MAVISAVVTDDCKSYWSQFLAGLLGNPGTTTVPGTPPTVYDPRAFFFRIGEGGWYLKNGVKTPREPSSHQRVATGNQWQDLHCRTNGPLYPVDSRWYYTKLLTPGDVTFEAPNTMRVRCLLDFGEANLDNYANPPEFWEIGIFADHPEWGDVHVLWFDARLWYVPDGS